MTRYCAIVDKSTLDYVFKYAVLSLGQKFLFRSDKMKRSERPTWDDFIDYSRDPKDLLGRLLQEGLLQTPVDSQLILTIIRSAFEKEVDIATHNEEKNRRLRELGPIPANPTVHDKLLRIGHTRRSAARILYEILTPYLNQKGLHWF